MKESPFFPALPTRDCPLETFREAELIRLELRIARRADQLAQANGSGRDRDIANWLQAEHEMWDQW